MAEGINIPKYGEWPGTTESFKLVREFVKPRIWDFITVIGIGIILALVVEIILAAVFKHSLVNSIIDDLFGIVIGSFLQATIIAMFFDVLIGKEFTLNSAMAYGLNHIFKMMFLLIVLDIIIIASLVLLIIPFLFIFPRVYIAPYFLVKNDCTVSEAIAASWHSTKGNMRHVWGITLLNIALAILFLTIIGIPLALYWGIINSASFALLTLYLSQPKHAKKAG